MLVQMPEATGFLTPVQRLARISSLLEGQLGNMQAFLNLPGLGSAARLLVSSPALMTLGTLVSLVVPLSTLTA